MKGLPDHLGGHKNRTHIDIGILKYAMNELGCKSMLDIGCGVGGQVYEAHKLGFDARGIDGDFTIEYEMPELFESHDFTKGKFEFKSHFDMVWCCEFIEHIKKDDEDNWLSLMQNAKNVFVTDGACMTSASCVNPSITYMALTARAANYAIDELKKRNL